MGAGPLSQAAPTQASVKQLGIIAALPAEARCLAGEIDPRQTSSPLYQLSEHACLCISGIGAEQAVKTGEALIQHGADALLSWGCAGALSPEVQAGDILLPQTIQPEASDALQTDSAWHARLLRLLSDRFEPVTGALAGSANIITEPARKQALYQSCGAVAVDMESAAIAKLARDAHIPFMAIRAIADEADTAIPACINKAMDQFGNINPARMLSLLLMHPTSWLGLMRLGRQFSTATSTLTLVSKTLGIDALLPPCFADFGSSDYKPPN